MRYLLLSDIHSNLEALYTCLELAAGKYDLAVCLGDLVGYGPNPNEVVDKVRNLCKIVIRGNHDKACCGIDDAKEFNIYARMATEWTRQALAPQHIEYLRALPMGPALMEGFIFVHGSPQDEDEYILGPAQALPLLRSPEAQVVCFGHTHVQGGFTLTEAGRFQSVHFPPATDALTLALRLEDSTRYLINPGSVGQPRDHDWRAAFAILDTDGKVVEYYRTPYDVGQTQAKMEKACLPVPLYRRLELGR
jgi:predicted phosphodiesterase